LGGDGGWHIFGNILQAIKLLVFPIQAILSHTFYVYSSIFILILISIFPVLFRDKKIIFSYLWFFITMASLYNRPSFASYNLYLQNIGFCLFMPLTIAFYTRLFFKNKKILGRLTLIGIILILLSGYSILTIKRNIYAEKASITADKFIKGVLKLYPHYPKGSTFYFINVPHLLAENQIYANPKRVASALSLKYDIYHKRIPVYVFTYMEDTLNIENEVEVEIKDNKTLIVSSRDTYLTYRPYEPAAEYALAEKIGYSNKDTKKASITAKKMRIILKEKTIKRLKKHFFYFTNGTVYELKNLG